MKKFGILLLLALLLIACEDVSDDYVDDVFDEPIGNEEDFVDEVDEDVDTAVSLFKWLRQSSYELIQTVADDVWQHEAYHSESGRMTFDDWLDTYTNHVPDHIAQMERIYAAWQAR